MSFFKRIIPGVFICFFIITTAYSNEIIPNRVFVRNLRKRLEKTKDDKERVDILNKFVDYLWGSDLEKAGKYTAQALQLARKINYHNGIVNAYNNLGFIKFFISDFDGALAEYKKALRKSYKSGYKDGFVAAYNGIGRYFQVKGTFDNALDKFLVSKDICEQIGNKKELAYCYYGLGAILFYDQQDNHNEALKYFTKSLELREEINDKNGITSSYYAIGEIFRKQEDYDTALEYFEKCRALSKEIGNEYNLANALEGMGDIFSNKKEYGRAIENYETSLEKFTLFKEGFQYIAVLIRLGAVNNKIKNYEKGLEYLSEAFKKAESLDVPVLIMTAADELHKIYKGLRDDTLALKFKEIAGDKKNFLKDNEMIKLKIFSDIEKEKKRKRVLQASLFSGCFLLTLSIVLFRMFRIKQKSLKNVEMLNEIGKVITSSLSQREIYIRVYENVRELMDADAFLIFMYREKAGELVFIGGKEKGVDDSSQIYKLSEEKRPAVKCFNEQKDITFSDYQKEYPELFGNYPPRPKVGKSFNSHIFLPLTIAQKNGEGKKTIGVITVQSPKKKAYNKYHVNILKNISVYAAIALDNACAYKQLKKANEWKSRLLEIAVHELKNPLQIIMGFSEQLEKKLKNDVTASSFLTNVAKSSKQMERLIDELLVDAAIEKGEIKLKNKTVDFSKLVEFVSATHRIIAESKKQQLIIDCENGCLVKGDKDRLREIIENLISNAIKFSPGKKKIRIKIKKNETRVHFKVRDEGPGLTEEDKKRIFKRFQRLSAKPTGGESVIGLGLAITKYFVELHYGCVRVESEYGKGAAFIVELPIYKSKNRPKLDAKEINYHKN